MPMYLWMMHRPQCGQFLFEIRSTKDSVTLFIIQSEEDNANGKRCVFFSMFIKMRTVLYGHFTQTPFQSRLK